MRDYLSMLVAEVYAQGAPTGSVVNPLSAWGNATVANLLTFVINVIIGVSIGLTVIFIAVGGIQIAMAKEDPKAAEGGRRTVTNAAIGGAVAAGAVTLRAISSNLIGASTTGISGITI